MNVIEEQQANCVSVLHVEVPVDRVAREWDGVVDEFKKHASLRGYRKGFAPRKLIESHFSKEIRDELQRTLLHSTLQEAIKNKALMVVSILGFENIELEKNRPLRFSAKIATVPVFELPDYIGIELNIPAPVAAEEIIANVLEGLQHKESTYEPVEGRGLEMGDFAVVSYTTQCEGLPLEESMPEVPGPLRPSKNVWVQLGSQIVLPGFSESLLGLQPGETKSFELEVASDFSIEPLRGKKVAFEVILEAINKENLPEWSDELAGQISPGKTLPELQAFVRKSVEEANQYKFESRKRQGVINFLLSNIQTELPVHLVESETTKVIREILKENEAYGLTDDQILSHQDEIIGLAKKGARDRVLAKFVLLKIAAKENMQLTEQDLLAQVMALSQRYDIPIVKLVKDISREGASGWVRQEALIIKALDFVVSSAIIHQTAPEEAVPVDANSALPEAGAE